MTALCLSGANTLVSAQEQAGGVRDVAGGSVAVASSPVVTLEIETFDGALDAASGATARLYRVDRTAPSSNAQALRTRVWWGSGAAGVGAGTDWSAAPAALTVKPLRPVVGVRANVSSDARLVLEVRGAASRLDAMSLPGVSVPESRVALEFKSAKSPAQNLRNGLFRVQLSNTSAVFVKPRSGGVVVSYRSQF